MQEINLLVKNKLYRYPRISYYLPNIGLYLKESHKESAKDYHSRIFSIPIIDKSISIWNKKDIIINKVNKIKKNNNINTNNTSNFIHDVDDVDDVGDGIPENASEPDSDDNSSEGGNLSENELLSESGSDEESEEEDDIEILAEPEADFDDDDCQYYDNDSD